MVINNSINIITPIIMKTMLPIRSIHFFGTFVEIKSPKYAPMKQRELNAKHAPNPTSKGKK